MTQLTLRRRRFRAAHALLALGFVLAAAPAHAQYRPRPVSTPVSGETFHLEAGVAWWNPTSDLTITSGGSGALSGIAGTTIDAKSDLGFTDKRLPQFQLTLRPGAAHKLRLQYIPINYTASSTLSRDIDFNGQRYRIGLPVESTLDWKAFRFGYEYDFLRRDTGFAGFITELKYTDMSITLSNVLATEFVQKRAPIPAVGGIGRVYVVPQVSITGEATFFKLPTIEDKYSGHYVDVDIYGTVNFTNNVGVQGGYRTLNLGYLIEEDSGAFKLKGLYVGVIARF
jgi:hypothetical protein